MLIRLFALALFLTALVAGTSLGGPEKSEPGAAETPAGLARVVFRALREGKPGPLEKRLITAADVEATLEIIRRESGEEEYEQASAYVVWSGGPEPFAETLREKTLKAFERTLAGARELDEPIDWSKAEFGGLIEEKNQFRLRDGIECVGLHFRVRAGERSYGIKLVHCIRLERGWVCVGAIRRFGGARLGAEAPVVPPEPLCRPLTPEAKGVLKAYLEVKSLRGRAEKADEARSRAEEFAGTPLPDDAKLFLGLIWALAQEPEIAAEAMKQFVDGCDTQTKNYETGITRLIQTYVELGRTDDAAGYVDKYIETFPAKTMNHGKLQYNVARAMMAAGDFAGAARLCEEAVRNDYGVAPQPAIECLWALGRYDEARTRADEYVELFRSGPFEKLTIEMAALTRKLGEPAPTLDIVGWAENESLSLADAKGRVTLVYFWDLRRRWAEKIELNLKRRLFEQYADKGLNIVGVSKQLQYDLLTGRQDQSFGLKEEVEQLEHWKYNFKTPWPLGLSAGDRVHEAYGFRALPSYALVGKGGKYRFYFCDASADALDVLAAVIERLLAE